MAPENRKITLQQAKQLLKTHETIVTHKEAKLLLDFLYKFGESKLSQVLSKRGNRFDLPKINITTSNRDKSYKIYKSVT